MIITKRDFLTRASLDHATLDIWIQEEWLIPGGMGDDLAFSEADLARAKLIRDLIDDLGVNAEGVGVVLHLLDQLHGMRRAMAEGWNWSTSHRGRSPTFRFPVLPVPQNRDRIDRRRTERPPDSPEARESPSGIWRDCPHAALPRF